MSTAYVCHVIPSNAFTLALFVHTQANCHNSVISSSQTEVKKLNGSLEWRVPHTGKFILLQGRACTKKILHMTLPVYMVLPYILPCTLLSIPMNDHCIFMKHNYFNWTSLKLRSLFASYYLSLLVRGLFFSFPLPHIDGRKWHTPDVVTQAVWLGWAWCYIT